MVTVGALVRFGLLVRQPVLQELIRIGERLETAIALVRHLLAVFSLYVRF